jgi:hypothetical protein
LFYSLYNETIVSNISLQTFGLHEFNNPSLSNPIIFDFISCSKDKYKKYINHQTSSNENYGYYFNENIAMFEIFSGKKIVINYFDEIDHDLIHTLLNCPFAILFSQRKKYVIHASSVIYEDKVFCFCGKSLAGKSSTAAYLINAGGILLSEDICVFDYFNNKLMILPSYNFLKLSDELSNYTNICSEDPIKFFKKLTDRKGHTLDSKRFASEPRAVDYFIYLQWSEGPSNLKQLNNEDSFKNLFSNEFIEYSQESALHRFKAASTLVSEADHYLYSREKKLNTLDHFVEIINQKLI